MVKDNGVTSPEILKIKKIKEDNNAKLILYFLIHSEYRKGADIALEALQFIQKKHPNAYLVLKSQGGQSQILDMFRKLKTIEVKSWLKPDVLRQLYDVCDVLIVPSRGGGFELNALEGVARGLPTIVPKAGCFMDYINFCIPVNVTDRPKIFADNPIHIGSGWEVSVDDLAYTLSNVLDDLDYFKQIAKTNAVIARDRYNWKNICEKLYEILMKYGFCDEE
jgi:glycosyltransferase involved in cell wall biosynthesis